MRQFKELLDFLVQGVENNDQGQHNVERNKNVDYGLDERILDNW